MLSLQSLDLDKRTLSRDHRSIPTMRVIWSGLNGREATVWLHGFFFLVIMVTSCPDRGKTGKVQTPSPMGLRKLGGCVRESIDTMTALTGYCTQSAIDDDNQSTL